MVANRAGAHGLAIRDGKLYLATVKEVFVADIQPDGTLGPLKMIIGDLPDAGQHPNRTMAFGPDGMLYISVGSTCNACNESNPENATILRAAPDGKSRTIFASGLRNTIGFDWHPKTGELWGMDHGIDFLGDEVQPEELNRIERGKQYGWPHVWGDGGINPQSTPRRRNHQGAVEGAERADGAGLHGPRRADADGVLHGQRLPGGVPGRCVRDHARLVEPQSGLGLRDRPRPLRRTASRSASSPS